MAGMRPSSFFMTRRSMTTSARKNSGKMNRWRLLSATPPSLRVRAMAVMNRTVISPATTETSNTPAYTAFIRKKTRARKMLATARLMALLSRSRLRTASMEKATKPIIRKRCMRFS